MKKNGFTLVELLAVIVVLAIIIILVAPSLLGSADSTKKKAFETKVGLIETSAAIYGQDKYRVIVNAAERGDSNFRIETEDGVRYAIEVKRVGDLVPDYVEKDRETAPYIQDPRDNSKSLDDYTVTIRINLNTRKVTAEFDES